MLSAYTISPLKGITAEEFGVEVTYRIGVTSTSYKFLPLIDDFMKLGDKPGALVEFRNKCPLDDFLKKDADLTARRPDPLWQTPTRISNCFLTDGIVSLANTAHRHLLICLGC